MLSANRSFQAQNSTCSTLLQTMLLYETCIVLSRKCFWDVNKDFWYRWCNLVITTLSARTMCRQIPVSYLQTWYYYECFLWPPYVIYVFSRFYLRHVSTGDISVTFEVMVFYVLLTHLHRGSTSEDWSLWPHAVSRRCNKWHPNSSRSLSKIYCSKRLVDDVTSQTSHLTFLITEEKRKNYLFKKIRNKKLNRIISRGIL